MRSFTRPRLNHRNFALFLCFALTATAVGSTSQPAAAETRAEARKLAGEALDLLDAGDCAGALDKFADAYELLPVPTIKIRMARFYDELDRLDEAVETYREVIGIEIKASAPKTHKEARDDAKKELSALLSQVPNVTLMVSGPGAGQARVTRDGARVMTRELGKKKALNPGSYTFVAVVDGREVSEVVNLKRGADVHVTLQLPEPKVVVQESESGVRAAGWVMTGIGSGGLLLGGITGVMLVGEQSDLERRCPDRQCPPEAHSDAESFDTLRTLSGLGLIGGGLLAVTGITMVIAGGSGDEGAGDPSVESGLYQPRLKLEVRPNGALLIGSF